MQCPSFVRHFLGAVLTALSTPLLLSQAPVRAQHVPPLVRSGQAAEVGSLDPSQHLHLTISLPLRNEAALDALLADLYNPASVNFHHYLGTAEFDARFGPTEGDYNKLVSWAQSSGFLITATAANRRLIEVDAPVAVVNRALHIAEKTFRDPALGREFHAPDTEPKPDLDIPLLAIDGLENSVPKHSHLKKAPAALPDTIAAPSGLGMLGDGVVANAAVTPHITGSGPGNTYLPSDMRAAYYGSGSLTGTGQTVAIFSYDGYLASDLTLYYSKIGMSSSVPVKNVLVGGYNGACFGFTSSGQENPNTCDDGEQILDIVQVQGMAPGLSQILFYEGSSSTSVLNQMVSDNTAKVISSSWGGGDFGTASDAPFKQMAAQGQTYLNATGDSGAFNSSTYDPPSLDPYITQVGGTDLTTTGAGGAWSAETGWVDSGGGYYASAGYSIPTWQQTAGVITSTNKGSASYRNAPDVAAEANFDNTTADDGQFESGYGGTSYATPRVAGYIALANQQAVANGKSTLGFINPSLYTLGLGSSSATVYHDITSGTNPASKGSGSFTAVAGYDLVTGWGSPNGPGLINALVGSSTPTADFSLAASPAGVSVTQGKTATTTVTVTDSNGFTGSVALTVSGLPTGVTASFSPASTTTSSTLTFTASSSAAVGTSTVTVTGTSSSLTHTTAISLTVASSGTSTQLIVNGGFETGAATPWSLSTGVLCSNSACTGETAHTGSYFAWLDGYGTTHTDTASQSVAIPAGKSTATFSFYLHVDTKETTTTKAYDTFTVQLTNTAGTVLTTLATFSNLNAAGGYALHSYNVAAYAGQTVVVKFTGKEDASLATSFVLDDVTLTVQ